MNRHDALAGTRFMRGAPSQSSAQIESGGQIPSRSRVLGLATRRRGDLEGRSRGAGRALRPVLMAARRIDPFRRTALPLLPRRAAEDPLETRGCYLDDRQAALSRRKFGDGFCFDGLDT